MPSLYDKTLRWLERLSEQPGGKKRIAGMAKAPSATFYKVFRGHQTNAEDYLTWLERLGAKIVLPDDAAVPAHDVKFVHVHKTVETEHLPAPRPDLYRAVPLVASEVAAGPGLIPEDRVLSWVVVDTTEPLVQRRSGLLAVRVARGQRSMLPLIQPGDILFVDRHDTDAARGQGAIFLVRDPDEGEAVKKVKVFSRRGKSMVTFFSLNADEYPPDTYSIDDDFRGDPSRGIIGRVVGLWADLTKR